MKRRLQRLNLEQVTEEAIQETAEDYLELNREQLYQGKTSMGQELLPTYRSEVYAQMKNDMNPAPGLGIPDLKLTGAFYQGLSLEIQAGQIQEESDVEYAGKLFEKYDDIVGLDEVKLDEYRAGPFKEALEEKIKQVVYG